MPRAEVRGAACPPSLLEGKASLAGAVPLAGVVLLAGELLLAEVGGVVCPPSPLVGVAPLAGRVVTSGSKGPAGKAAVILSRHTGFSLVLATPAAPLGAGDGPGLTARGGAWAPRRGEGEARGGRPSADLAGTTAMGLGRMGEARC